ncbi:MAG TPA: ferric reductase-like transmembrane domain-containing protein, partial [Dermatophilaceae bacterium]
MLVVVALWVAGGGVQGLSSLGAALTSVGRLTGLVASDLLLIQVLLMARIPLVEQSYGQDELARRHRLVGFTSFNLMVVHIVTITAGYAAASTKGLWGTIVAFVLDYPGMLLAIAGTLALVMVPLTSIKAARKRLRYESWHLLHLYAYLGVGLALPHQLWTGKDFLTSPWATAFWWSLWAGAAGAV